MEEAFGKSFAKAQQLRGVSLSSFIASVSLSAVMFAIEVLVFIAIRKRFPDL
jgi:energy-coupling factor transporter transmembrane protein EcfT